MVETTRGSDSHSTNSSVNLDGVFIPPDREEWIKTALKGLPNHDSIDSLARRTLDNIAIHALYDNEAAQLTSPLHTRRIMPGSWDNRLAVPALDSEGAVNDKILEGLRGGISSLELPVKKESSLKRILNGVNLAISPVSFRTDGYVAECMNQILEIARENQQNEAVLQCYFNNDPIGLWLAGHGGSELKMSALDKLPAFALELESKLPEARSIVIDIAIHHNAGATVLQELVAAIATASAYLESLTTSGLSIEQANRHIVFQVACDADVLMGVVKLRSLNLLWQHVLSQYTITLKDSTSVGLPNEHLTTQLNVETSRRFLSKQDHWNNHLRNIAACTAAALGNAGTILIKPHDRMTENHAESKDSIAERVARNIPIILDRECGLTKVTDPMAGSFAIETLTMELVEHTWKSLSTLTPSERWLEMLNSGAWQMELSQAHNKRIARLNNNDRVIVGVNRYQPEQLDQTEHTNGIACHPYATVKPRLLPVRDSELFESSSATTNIEQTGDVS